MPKNVKISKSGVVGKIDNSGKSRGLGLTREVQMYPTPRARDHFPPMNPEHIIKNSQGWTSIRKKSGVRYGATLPDVVNKTEKREMYPTPTQRDYKGQNSMKHIMEKPRHNTQLPNALRKKGIVGQLNPNWVTWLMGYPPNWVNLE
jgi:hypothetical protein